ncbi:hypothetical protein [Streptomyces geranii]|uniref:hypothetical protein n=1 Tax=Streptomyces geranii TaxID=2058923 RepID=UPI000D030B3E|nr:hypothetical protein [Streptomyces geranii]
MWSPWDNFDKQVGKYRCGIVPDWWWQGWISISFYDSQGTFLGNQWRSAFWVFGGTLGMYFE